MNHNLTMSQVINAGAVRSAKPSREFMVQQAVLNTLHDWFRTTIDMEGLKAAGMDMLEMTKFNQPAAAEFGWQCRAEFRKIAAQYSDAP